MIEYGKQKGHTYRFLVHQLWTETVQRSASNIDADGLLNHAFTSIKDFNSRGRELQIEYTVDLLTPDEKEIREQRERIMNSHYVSELSEIEDDND